MLKGGTTLAWAAGEEGLLPFPEGEEVVVAAAAEEQAYCCFILLYTLVLALALAPLLELAFLLSLAIRCFDFKRSWDCAGNGRKTEFVRGTSNQSAS